MSPLAPLVAPLHAMGFSLKWNKSFWSRSQSQKFWMPGAGAAARNLYFDSTALVPTTANLAPGFLSASFLKQVAIWSA